MLWFRQGWGRLLLLCGLVVGAVVGSASLAFGSPLRALACGTGLVLGSSNSCDAQTTLAGNVNASLLKLQNANAGAAAYGLQVTSPAAIGLLGQSTSGRGV